MQDMKLFGTGVLILLIVLIVAAGCTGSSPAPATLPVTTTAIQPPATAAHLTETSPVAVKTAAPQVTVTVIHYIVPDKTWKDTGLHMAFSAPETWNVTTRLMNLPEGSQGLVYQTELVSGDVFSIITYPSSLNEDQAYRNTFRTWSPAPAESTVTINGITYDRFESSANGKTRVGYVVQKSSASDIGFASVITYVTDMSRPFEREDFEKVVSSFRYFTTDQAATMTGAEIPRVR
jgi:hypothetical protein